MGGLVGHANFSSVIIDGKSYKSLLDNGSMVTTMSESAFRSLPSKPSFMSLNSLGLSLSIADGTSMKYISYIEISLSIPSVDNFILYVPILVIPDNQFNSSCPVIVCTNVLRRCRNTIQECSSSIGDAWMSAVSMLDSNTFSVPCTVGPFQTTTINGIVRNLPSDVCNAVAETPENTNLAYTVCASLIQLDRTSSSCKIPVRICNITAKPLIFKPKALLCDITKAGVVDDLVSNLTPSKTPSCKKPDVTFNTSNLSSEQVDRFQDVLYKWNHIFCSSTKDIGKTDLVKHKIVLEDLTPFKEPYCRIPPAMFEKVRQHIKEMLDAGVIRESESPYSSNKVLICKPN